MNAGSPIYNELNKAWKSTCRILLSEEIGELEEYDAWLKEYMPAFGKRKSHISKKETMLTLNGYCDSARFISLEENREKSIDALTINEIKDIDSVLQAISDKWEYCGNKVLGNSSNVEASDDIVDSNYVSDSISVDRGDHLFANGYVTDAKNCFGSVRFTRAEFAVRCARFSASNRCFNSYWLVNTSDIYCSTNLVGCSDMLFCFNQRGKNKCIGNLALPVDKFSALKKKLIGEMREELKRNKQFPFIFKLIPSVPPRPRAIELVKDSAAEQRMDIAPVEKAFVSAFKVLFRKDVEGMSQYRQWLWDNISSYSFDEIDSPFGSKTYRFNPEYYTIFADYPKGRAVTYGESIKLADLHLEEKDLASLTKIKENLGEIAYLTEEGEAGKSINIEKTVYADNDINAYWFAGRNNEFVAFCPYVFDTKYAFGCNKIINSQYVIRCNNSFKLTRCFELDSCSNCSDTYFAHNCESIYDGMFCWNAKSKRHAVGNTELQLDQYRKIKEILVEQMADEIIKNKSFRYDIFNIGCYKK
jgi:hypothetical protein